MAYTKYLLQALMASGLALAASSKSPLLGESFITIHRDLTDRLGRV